MRILFTLFSLSLLMLVSCNNKPPKENELVHLVTLDPGHFHAALVQKTMYKEVDSVVQVYAPAGEDLQQHLDRINAYNTRADNPTHWKEEVYTGTDFLEKMFEEEKARSNNEAGRSNVVVLSGNNQKKTEYILKSLENGFNVLADKPMVIDNKGFEELKQAFKIAEEKKLILYDIMTERYEITTQLQKELSLLPEIFGILEKGTKENPAITKESVHHFYKYVSGNVLTRPAWFLDANQQGEGIVDVMTHLVDLVQWECFPDQVIDTNQISIQDAKSWTTDMGLSEFSTITQLKKFPAYLKNNIADDTLLHIYCNGVIDYTINGVHAKTAVIWRYKAPEGTGDTHYSIMRGTKANLVIRQGATEAFQPALYIEPIAKTDEFEKILFLELKKIEEKYPGIKLAKSSDGWQVIIPEKYKEGHEAHFARVTEKFLEYLKNKNMPAWEVPNMISKYFTTTSGLAFALKNQ